MPANSIAGQAPTVIQQPLRGMATAGASQNSSSQAAASPVEGQVQRMKAQARPDSHAKAMLEFGAQASKDYAVGMGLSVVAAVAAATFPVSLLLYALWSSRKSAGADDAQAKSELDGVEGAGETRETDGTESTDSTEESLEPTNGEIGETDGVDSVEETSQEHLRNLAEPAPSHHVAPLQAEDYTFPHESPTVTPGQVLTQADIARMEAQHNQRIGKPV